MGQSVIKPLFLRDKLNANYSSKVLSSPLVAFITERNDSPGKSGARSLFEQR